MNIDGLDELEKQKLDLDGRVEALQAQIDAVKVLVLQAEYDKQYNELAGLVAVGDRFQYLHRDCLVTEVRAGVAVKPIAPKKDYSIFNFTFEEQNRPPEVRFEYTGRKGSIEFSCFEYSDIKLLRALVGK